MAYVIDRRPNNRNKSAVNRQRFLKRHRAHVRKAVAEAISRRSITDIDKGERISIPTRDVSEPIFGHGPGGERERVYPGNREFVTGDKIPRPKRGAGAGSRASNTGGGADAFQFELSQDEFLDVMFDGLELPYMVKRQLAGTDVYRMVRAGYSQEGSPNQINVVRSMRSALARRIALVGRERRRVRELEVELEALGRSDEGPDRRLLLRQELRKLNAKIKRIAWLDTYDLKYNLLIKQPVPRSKAVMFCLMDVSGSMDQVTKDIAKRFFILLYLFLKRNYDRIDVVFIRHHTNASEVDEEEFFYSRDTGGTIVSSALKLMKEIVAERYPTDQWNIYGAQASDGDNWDGDSATCCDLLCGDIMPIVQYYAYVEITKRSHQALWTSYLRVKEAFSDHFAMQHIVEASDIFPVFRDLFAPKQA